jgi:hypothetical protein
VVEAGTCAPSFQLQPRVAVVLGQY